MRVFVRKFLLAITGGSLALLSGLACTFDQEHQTATDDSEISWDVKKLLVRAQEAYERNAFRVALAVTDSVKQYAPDLPDVYFLEGRIYTRLHQFNRAETAYDSVLARDPTHQGVHLNLGINSYRQEQYREALSMFAREGERYPTATVFLEMGRTYIQMGEYDSARVALKKSIRLDSTKATAYMWLGKLYQYIGELEKALHYSRRGLHLDSVKVNYHYLLGTQLLEAGQSEEAMRHLRHVVEHQPWHPGAYHSLGRALTRVGRSKEAEKYLVKVDTLQQLDAKIATLQSETKIYPYQSKRWIKLGDALRTVGRLNEAFEAYTVASALEPRNMALQNNLANLSADLGHTEKAISHYRSILKEDSSQADIWINLGVVYANSNQYKRASKAWQQVLKIDPSNTTARRYLAKLSEMAELSTD